MCKSERYLEDINLIKGIMDPPLPLPGGDDQPLALPGAHSSYVHELAVIGQVAGKNEKENDQFRSFLKQQDAREVDNIVFRLNAAVSAVIDCTACGNCCRSLMINILPQEAESVAAHLNMPIPEFKKSFVEESEQGQLIMNSIPCHFLHENKCSIYDQRFLECREFPHLHKPGFTNRLFGTFMHYERCPIIFNVIEQLKQELSFSRNETLLQADE